jgi:hypothetical protein
LNTPTARNAALLVARDTSARVSTQCRMRGFTRGFASRIALEMNARVTRS